MSVCVNQTVKSARHHRLTELTCNLAKACGPVTVSASLMLLLLFLFGCIILIIHNIISDFYLSNINIKCQYQLTVNILLLFCWFLLVLKMDDLIFIFSVC